MDDWEATTTLDSNATGDVPRVHDVPSLTVLAGEIQRTYRLPPVARIGRGRDAEIRLANDEVSRHHIELRRIEDGSYTVVDLDSKNGTRINGQVLPPGTTRSLRYGDRITLGRTVLLLFTPQDDIEEQLLLAQRLESLGRLAGGIAHDFNNLLGTVLTNLSYLARLSHETRLDNPDVVGALTDSHSALRRAVELTRQLLGFARKGREADRAVNFSEVVSEVVRMLRRTVDPQITITEEIAPKLVVLADAHQLQQVLMNLVLNAADAMPDGGTIHILLKEGLGGGPTLPQRPFVLLEVQDDGEGMDELTRARAFEPFFTTKERGRGTGLGLAMVYGVAKSHGGEAYIDSQIGKGTKVRFALPVASAPDIQTPATMARTSSETLEGMVLLVDDEELFRASAARLLRHLGFQVASVGSGKEAVEMVRAHPGVYRVALLDLMMPEMSGEDAFHALRTVEPGIQVILISGNVENVKVEPLLAAGARTFVTKPFDLDTLRKELRAAVEASSPAA